MPYIFVNVLEIPRQVFTHHYASLYCVSSTTTYGVLDIEWSMVLCFTASNVAWCKYLELEKARPCDCWYWIIVWVLVILGFHNMYKENKQGMTILPAKVGVLIVLGCGFDYYSKIGLLLLEYQIKVPCRRVWYGWQIGQRRCLCTTIMQYSCWKILVMEFIVPINSLLTCVRLIVKSTDIKYSIKKHIISGDACNFVGSSIVSWAGSIGDILFSFLLGALNLLRSLPRIPNRIIRYYCIVRVNGLRRVYIDFMAVEWQFEVKDILKHMGSTFCLIFAPIGEAQQKVMCHIAFDILFLRVLLWFDLLVWTLYQNCWLVSKGILTNGYWSVLLVIRLLLSPFGLFVSCSSCDLVVFADSFWWCFWTRIWVFF